MCPVAPPIYHPSRSSTCTSLCHATRNTTTTTTTTTTTYQGHGAIAAESKMHERHQCEEIPNVQTFRGRIEPSIHRDYT